MKTLTLLAILALSTPAFAGHRHSGGGGGGHRYHNHGGSRVVVSYGRPYYNGYYRSYPSYRSYGYGYGANCYPYRSYYSPGISFALSSYAPAYYNTGYTRSY